MPILAKGRALHGERRGGPGAGLECTTGVKSQSETRGEVRGCAYLLEVVLVVLLVVRHGGRRCVFEVEDVCRKMERSRRAV